MTVWSKERGSLTLLAIIISIVHTVEPVLQGHNMTYLTIKDTFTLLYVYSANAFVVPRVSTIQRLSLVHTQWTHYSIEIGHNPKSVSPWCIKCEPGINLFFHIIIVYNAASCVHACVCCACFFPLPLYLQPPPIPSARYTLAVSHVM